MPLDLTGWRRVFAADGVAFHAPGGAADGVIRVRERLRPLRRVKDLVDEVLAEQAAAGAPCRVTRLQRFTTEEGELAALVLLAGEGPGAPCSRLLGLVYTDDFYARVDGVVNAEVEWERLDGNVRHIVRHLPIGLGHPRRRRFQYDPPPGWQARPRFGVAEWFPPDFPRRHAIITVLPAKPLAPDTPTVLLDRLLHEASFTEFVRLGDPVGARLNTPLGLAGSLIKVNGAYPGRPHVHVDTVVLADRFWVYLLRLESQEADLAEHRRVFMTMVQSTSPLPTPEPPPGAPRHDPSDMFHWVTN